MNVEEYDSAEDAPVDRLTQLPDPIIHHILSFLDAKSVVQTSVLSRPWRSTWKHVSIINLCGISFRNLYSFATFLDKISSLRCHDINLRKVSYYQDLCKDREHEWIDAVIKFAAAHDAEAALINSRYRSSSELFCPERSSSNDTNLKTLTLSRVWIDNDELGSFPGFSMLTRLKLYPCHIGLVPKDPFRKFPCLKDLVMHDIWFHGTNSLKVSGLQLLSLELRPYYGRCYIEIEIDAPKLESFTLDLRYVEQLPRFGETNIPSLSRVDFYLGARGFKPQDFVPFARLFHRVRCVSVNARIIWDLDRENPEHDAEVAFIDIICTRKSSDLFCPDWRSSNYTKLKTDLVMHNFKVYGTDSTNNSPKVFGPELLHLDFGGDYKYIAPGVLIEIDAPKLESFVLDLRYAQILLPRFGEMNVPSLARVDLHLNLKGFAPKVVKFILRRFQHVRYVAVNSRVIWDLDEENGQNVASMGKMNGEETHAAPVDRLTPLPDPIIHHILSFLDTKSSVKTSVLSRPWKSMWKHVPILDLDREDFSKSFRRLDTFLDKIFRHPEINLKTLILSSVWIEDNELGSFPGFSMVTSLNLHNCAFWFKLERDPFRRFPCLKDLVVHDYWGTVNNKLKVSGPELLSLELRPESNYCTKAQMIEIDAPKLESFTLDFRTYAKQLPCFGEMNIPSLVRVDLYPKFSCLRNLVVLDSKCYDDHVKVFGIKLISLELTFPGPVEIAIESPLYLY
ncbi:FBD-associated F-box protein At5g18780 [Linum grandiflorum]